MMQTGALALCWMDSGSGEGELGGQRCVFGGGGYVCCAKCALLDVRLAAHSTALTATQAAGA
jgi:hypothetical protein